MANFGQERKLERFVTGGCAVGASVAYAGLAGLHLMVAPIPQEVVVLAWAAPGIAFAGLAAWLRFGPGVLISLTNRRS